MGKKKGFTLIELLAVLVILATILAISMPKILDAKDGAKRKSFKNDVDEIQGIAQLEYNNTKEARYYTFKDGVQTNENGEADKLEFKGDNPGEGYLKIYPNGDVEYYLKNKDLTLCARKEVGDRKGQIVKCENINNKITLDLRLTKSTNSIRVIALPKIGEANAIIDTYYYQLNDGKILTSNKASHLFENLKRTDKNGNLINYKVNVKVCTKKGVCESKEKITTLDDIKQIDYKITSEPDKILGGWSLKKTITFTYPEIKNINDQNIEKNEISIDGGTTWKIYRGSITVDKDTTFIARITDGTNTVSSKVITLSNFDHEGPNITGVTGNPDKKWTNKDVTLTVNATDSKSGLADAAYSFDGGKTWQASASKTYKSNTNGIVIKVKDKVGNISTYPTINITKIDKTGPSKPSISLVRSDNNGYSSGSWTNQSVLTDVRSSDSQSGIAYYQYSHDNQNWSGDISTLGWTYEYYSDKDVLRYWITWNGQWDFYIRSVDNAGNVSESSDIFTIRIDKTPPICAGWNGENNHWSKNNVTVSAKCYDDDSKCSSPTSNTQTFSSNARTAVASVYISDNAGNVTNCKDTVNVFIAKSFNIEYEVDLLNKDATGIEMHQKTTNDKTVGTGQFRAIHSTKITKKDNYIDGDIQYQLHNSGKGWSNFVSSGTVVRAPEPGEIVNVTQISNDFRRQEGIEIKLTGELEEAFDVFYKVHVQTQGDLGWAKNGETAGSQGLCKRMEKLTIQILPKGELPSGYNPNFRPTITDVSASNCRKEDIPPQCNKTCVKKNPISGQCTENYYDYSYGVTQQKCRNAGGKCGPGTTWGSNCTCRIPRSRTITCTKYETEYYTCC